LEKNSRAYILKESEKSLGVGRVLAGRIGHTDPGKKKGESLPPTIPTSAGKVGGRPVAGVLPGSVLHCYALYCSLQRTPHQNDDGVVSDYVREDHFKHLQGESRESLEAKVEGIDRGVIRPVQFGKTALNYTPQQRKKLTGHERHLRQLQRKLARQTAHSKRRSKTSARIARKKERQANIRHDFCHKASHTMVNSDKSVLVFENLKTKNMTRTAKGSLAAPGKKVKQKSGLNRSILAVGWHKIQLFTEYKAERAGKAVFYVSAHHTSQECAHCGHTHPDNRKSQSIFRCVRCDHTDNADVNAAGVIKKRAIRCILDSGTELSDKGLLQQSPDIGRGASSKTDILTRMPHQAKKRQQKTAGLAA
jgi:putative transposase